MILLRIDLPVSDVLAVLIRSSSLSLIFFRDEINPQQLFYQPEEHNQNIVLKEIGRCQSPTQCCQLEPNKTRSHTKVRMPVHSRQVCSLLDFPEIVIAQNIWKTPKHKRETSYVLWAFTEKLWTCSSCLCVFLQFSFLIFRVLWQDEQHCSKLSQTLAGIPKSAKEIYVNMLHFSFDLSCKERNP